MLRTIENFNLFFDCLYYTTFDGACQGFFEILFWWIALFICLFLCPLDIVYYIIGQAICQAFREKLGVEELRFFGEKFVQSAEIA